MLMIRLSRTGARKQPQYRVVVIEKERARNGRPVEVVGTYNPRTSPASIELKRERIDYWVSKGAKMSDRVSKIVSRPAPASAASGCLIFGLRLTAKSTTLQNRMIRLMKKMSEPTGDMRVLIEQIAKALVDDPAQVAVNQVEEDGESVLELTVGPNDLGRVIGKQGRTARAMRNLLGCGRFEVQQAFHAGDSGIADEFITLARVLKTQGRRGEVATEPHSDVPDRFQPGMRLWALPKDGTDPGAS